MPDIPAICFCEREATDGFPGGNGGDGGAPGKGGDGGAGATIYLVGPAETLTKTLGFQIFNSGGRAGQNGSPGQGGARGLGGDSGYAPAKCKKRNRGADGNPGVTPPPSDHEPVDGADGQTLLIAL